MINRNNKKGFTIVELVIVIAVIAILAGVLIPTFAGIIRKANVSNDTVVAKNMNTALVAYSATNGTPESFSEVLEALEEAGYVLANLNASAKGNLYGWDQTNNQIVYIDKDGAVLFQTVDFNKEDLQFIIAGEAAELPEGYVADKLVLLPSPSTEQTLRNSLESGVSVTLTEDVVLSSTVTIPARSNVVLDLGGKTLSTNVANPDTEAQNSEYIKVSEGATLTIKNGTFVGRGIMNYGNLTVEANTKVYANDPNGGAAIRNKTGKVTINGGEFYSLKYDKYEGVVNGSFTGGANVVYNETGEVVINDGTFVSGTEIFAITQLGTGSITINGGTFKSVRGVVASQEGGTVTINKGTFTKTCDFVDPADRPADGYTSGQTIWVDDSGATITIASGVVVNGNTVAAAVTVNADSSSYN